MTQAIASLDWIPIRDARRLPVFYGADGSILEPFVEYGLFIARRKQAHSDQAFRTALDEVGYHLFSLCEYLTEFEIKWDMLADENVLHFRDWLHDRAGSRTKVRSPLSSKRTINRYLRTVYGFYVWLQQQGLLAEGHVGWPNGLIKTRLPDKELKSLKTIPSDQLFPLCFVRCGEGSRQMVQYTATDRDIDRLIDHFFEHHSLPVALRNDAIIMLAKEVGWRQGSLASITIDQFDSAVLDRAEEVGYASIVPPRQKFGYENAFDVRVTVIRRIREYINDARRDLMEKRGWTERTCKEAVFINTVTGQPLSRKALSEIFSRAFRAIGAPKGAGIHSLRRKCADDTADVEVEARKREGRTTDPVNVGIVIKRLLGHSADQSQEVYARATIRATWQSLERRQQDRIAELEAQIIRLKARLAAP